MSRTYTAAMNKPTCSLAYSCTGLLKQKCQYLQLLYTNDYNNNNNQLYLPRVTRNSKHMLLTNLWPSI